MALLEAGQTLLLLTGSADGSAALWDLASGRQLTVMRHAQPLVAVALAGARLAATATRAGATLWTAEGRRLRSFEALPGCGGVACMALTDTRLLLGSNQGALQHCDLYSGRLQLITRHGNGITVIRPLRTVHLIPQQQQQQQQQEEGREQLAEEWHVILGLADGQVICVAGSTGGELWRLPNRYPSCVVDIRLLPGGAQQQKQQHQLLCVLNRRAQLICWQLPNDTGGDAAAAAAAAAATRLGQCSQLGQHTARHAAGSSSSSRGGVSPSSSSSSWPVTVCCLETHAAGATAASHQLTAPATAAAAAAAAGCTCCVVPPFGCGSLLVGGRGVLRVVALQQAADTGGAPFCSQPAPGYTNGGAAAASSGQATERLQATQLQLPHAAAPQSSSSSSRCCCCLLTGQQQRTLASAGSEASLGSWCSGRLHQMELRWLRDLSLARLGQLLAKRAPAAADRRPAEVTCLEFIGATGQLAAGLASGEVVLLKLRAARKA